MSTASVIAAGALVVAVAAVVIAVLAYRKLQAILRAQEVLLGGDGKQDMVDFAVSLQGRVDDLHRAFDELAEALARYDAYEDTGGHQSASMAMLDSAR